MRVVPYLGSTVFSFTYSYYNSFKPTTLRDVKNLPNTSTCYTTYATYIQQNTEASSYNHCCKGKAISITNSECVSVALGIQHTMHMHNTVMWPVQIYNIFPHYLINDTIITKSH